MIGGKDSEQEQIRKIACGDRGAMKDFYDAYAGYLTAVCSRYVVARDDVKDVLQESFIRIFDSIAKFEYRGPGALRAWASRIVVNESLKHLKAAQRLRTVEPVRDLVDAEEEDGGLDVEEVPTQVIMEMIRSLPEGYRTVFNLYVFEGMSHREIAARLNIAENSSASQLHRARGVLARQLKEYGSKKRDGNG